MSNNTNEDSNVTKDLYFWIGADAEEYVEMSYEEFNEHIKKDTLNNERLRRGLRPTD